MMAITTSSSIRVKPDLRDCRTIRKPPVEKKSEKSELSAKCERVSSVKGLVKNCSFEDTQPSPDSTFFVNHEIYRSKGRKAREIFIILVKFLTASSWPWASREGEQKRPHFLRHTKLSRTTGAMLSRMVCN